MPAAVRPPLLRPEEGPAAELVNPRGAAPICLVCEHASAFIPTALYGLGLSEQDRLSHAVWDIGADALARKLSARLDAPLVRARISRLVYDCNRATDAGNAIADRVERIAVPGNAGLTEEERRARIEEVYLPFRTLLSETLDRFSSPPALVTVHSFSPTWFGERRAVELGLLHDRDDRLAGRMLNAAGPAYRTELNQPYSKRDGVTHTLAVHAVPRGLENVMLEIRNDLLADAASVDRAADALATLIAGALADTSVGQS